MKTKILHIGVIDQNDKVHSVNFQDGVNVITGRSSTGKSALIEIFDYCFGSSDFTVPVGVITKCAVTYFSILQVEGINLILARRRNTSKAFLKEERNNSIVNEVDLLTNHYFDENYFLPLTLFKKELRLYFNIHITDVDEDEAIRLNRRNRSKSPTPSIRSLTSFTLQHQNLIANKHALFYRFDQKEKRDQAIDHMKVFLGLVDQNYFFKSQELKQLEQKKRALERALPRKIDKLNATKDKIRTEIRIYEASTGKEVNFTVDEALRAPKSLLSLLRRQHIELQDDSNQHIQTLQEINRERSIIISELRRKQYELSEIESSVEFSTRYQAISDNITLPKKAKIHAANCPFCESETNDIEDIANQLTDAIEWLNQELSRSSYRLDAFEEAREKVKKEINTIKFTLSRYNQEKEAIEKQIDDLEKVRTQYEIAVESKIKIEQALEEISNIKNNDTDQDLKDLDSKIQRIREELDRDYNTASRMKGIEERITSHLKEFTTRFEFEDSYDPIRLRFSIDTFDLWHQEGDKKVFLRSMGSGANWLSCHLVLFLALQRTFCELGNQCSIPSILFLDQPSQVYFPSILDGAEEFNPQELAEKDLSRPDKRALDDDIKAVNNLYCQFVTFCNETFQETEIMPQIIVTDHADNLPMAPNLDTTFEELVRKRWRKPESGFINRKVLEL